jgi:hypothetical protein
LKWYRYLGEKVSRQAVADQPAGFPAEQSFPGRISLGRIVEDVSETSRDRVTAVIVGHARTGYRMLVLGDRKKFDGLRQLSRMLHRTYMNKIGEGRETQQRIGLAPVEKIEEEVLRELLDAERSPWPFEMRAALRAALGMPVEALAPQFPKPPLVLMRPPQRRHRSTNVRSPTELWAVKSSAVWVFIPGVKEGATQQ